MDLLATLPFQLQILHPEMSVIPPPSQGLRGSSDPWAAPNYLGLGHDLCFPLTGTAYKIVGVMACGREIRLSIIPDHLAPA